jgi:cytochrome c biogenesis protein ResB
MVRTFFVVMMAFFVVGLVGCSSPEKRAAEADAEIAEEKVNIMKKYSECLEKFEGQKDVSEKCAPYKEASETFISK